MKGKQVELTEFGIGTAAPNKKTPWQEGQCIGWASIASNGNFANANARYGIFSCVRNSTGNYSVTFSQPVNNANEVAENVSCALSGSTPTTINSSVSLDGSNRPVVNVRITSPSILLGLINFNNTDAAFRISLFGRPL